MNAVCFSETGPTSLHVVRYQNSDIVRLFIKKLTVVQLAKKCLALNGRARGSPPSLEARPSKKINVALNKLDLKYKILVVELAVFCLHDYRKPVSELS
jgi:hypothetical protein